MHLHKGSMNFIVDNTSSVPLSFWPLVPMLCCALPLMQKSQVFSTYADNQTTVSIQIYGESKHST